MYFKSLKHVKQNLKALEKQKLKNNKRENHLYNNVNRAYKNIDWN